VRLEDEDIQKVEAVLRAAAPVSQSRLWIVGGRVGDRY